MIDNNAKPPGWYDPKFPFLSLEQLKDTLTRLEHHEDMAFPVEAYHLEALRTEITRRENINP